MKNCNYETPKFNITWEELEDVLTGSPGDPNLNDIYGNDDWVN